MKVLVFTQMYPSKEDPHNGTFIHDEVIALRKIVRNVSVLYVDTKLNRLNYFKSLALLKKKIRNFEPDIVHCHHTFCGFIALMAGFDNIVLTFHEGEYTSKEPYLALLRREGIEKFLVLSKKFKRFCLRKAKHVFDVTGALAQWPNTTSPFWPGVNFDIFHPVSMAEARVMLKWDSRTKYVLFPGNPKDTCKRFDIAQDIVNRVRPLLTQPIELFPLTNVPHDRVPLYMAGSDIMLLVSDYEASPMVVKEAAACGLPCITFDLGDVTVVLQKHPQSFIMPRDTQLVADKLFDTLQQSPAGRKNFLPKEYSTESVVEKIKSIYQNILTG